MRIIAGQWRGRRLQTPTGRDTRPTSDRVREALFSSIHSRVGSFAELRVLDAFAGSGALGLEALSRGAVFLAAVESDPKACRVIEANYSNLQEGSLQGSKLQKGSLQDKVQEDLRYASQESTSAKEQFRLYRGDIFKVMNYPQGRGLQGLAVDLAFFDPPYDLSTEKLYELLQALAEKGVFAYGALLTIERAKTKCKTEEAENLFPKNFTLLDTKTKGDTTLYFASYLP